MLTSVLFVLSLALLAGNGFLFWQLREQKALIRHLMDQDSQDTALPPPEPVLTLRIRDPIALAKRESRSARMLADHLPVMVSKMVYQEVQKELEVELRERQIDVDIQIDYR